MKVKSKALETKQPTNQPTCAKNYKKNKKNQQQPVS